MLQIGLSEIKAIEAEVQSSEDYISLSQGAIKVGGIPTEVKKHLQEVLNTDKTDYYQSAWGIMPLRERIAQHLSTEHGASFDAKNILVTHGAMGGIATLLLTLLEAGDEVILPEPTYPAYKNIIGVSRANTVYVSCLKNDETTGESVGWEIDVEKIKAARTSKTKVLIFSNPCNPSGAIIPLETLQELVSWCEKEGIYLIVDEAYDDYIFDGSFHSVGPLVLQSDFVIRVGSFSKSLSMSGWRIGFLVVGESLSRTMGITQDALLNCPNVLAQYAVLYALDHPEFRMRFRTIIEQNRDRAIAQLQPLFEKNIFSLSNPAAGFYLFLRTLESDSFDLCTSILRHAKVGLIPGRAFGPSGSPFLRLCYARQPEVLCEGIERIIKFFN